MDNFCLFRVTVTNNSQTKNPNIKEYIYAKTKMKENFQAKQKERKKMSKSILWDMAYMCPVYWVDACTCVSKGSNLFFSHPVIMKTHSSLTL